MKGAVLIGHRHSGEKDVIQEKKLPRAVVWNLQKFIEISECHMFLDPQGGGTIGITVTQL